jgi:hypothetical protein
MPITGTFLADFTQFNTAVQGAEVQLRSFESNSSKVASSLSRMTDQFSGRRIIQEATLMAEAIERIGGAAHLTDAELARVAVTAAEAANKMRAIGQDVPAGLQRLAGFAQTTTGSFAGIQAGATKTAGALGTLALSLGSVDKTLALVGVHIGPEIHALGELSTLATSATAAFTLLGPAAAVVGTAFAAWEVGKKIGEVTGLTAAVEEGARKFFMYGDAAEQTAAYKTEVLARASLNAKQPITDFGEAVRINGEAAKTAADKIAGHAAAVKADKEAADAAHEAFKKLTADFQKDIDEQNRASRAAADFETQMLLEGQEARKKIGEQQADISRILTEKITADTLARMAAMNQEILKAAELAASLQQSWTQMTGDAGAAANSFVASMDAINNKYDELLKRAGPAGPLREQNVGEIERLRAFELSNLAITGGAPSGGAAGATVSGPRAPGTFGVGAAASTVVVNHNLFTVNGATGMQLARELSPYLDRVNTQSAYTGNKASIAR